MLRPAEWAALAFVIYGLVVVSMRSGLGAALSVRPVTSSGATRVLVALCVVAVANLLRRAYAAGPKVPQTLRRAAFIGGAVAWFPLLLAVFAMGSERAAWVEMGRERLDGVLQLLVVAALRIAVVGAPLPALWAVMVLHVSERGRLEPGVLLRDAARGMAAGVREWLPMAVLIPAYWWVAEIIGTPDHERDPWLQAADRFLFLGHDPLDLAEQLISKPLSEWFAFCYSLFGLLFPLTLSAALVRGGRAGLREGVTLLSVGMAITFFSYTLVPVKGPVLTRTFAVPLDYYIMEDMKEALMDKTRIAWDCFPSFHTAGTLLMGALCARRARGLFWWLLPVIASMPFACVYLRYHYVTDVLAGVVLAVVVDRLSLRWLRAAPV